MGADICIGIVYSRPPPFISIGLKPGSKQLADKLGFAHGALKYGCSRIEVVLWGNLEDDPSSFNSVVRPALSSCRLRPVVASYCDDETQECRPQGHDAWHKQSAGTDEFTDAPFATAD
jgi:hypothetical protein